MSRDERQQSGIINSKRNDQSKSNDQNNHELFSNLIDPKTSPENHHHHLPSTSITNQSNKIHNHNHPQIAATTTTATTTASNEMSNTQTKLVANLHSAANDGKVELVRLLLRCGADVNAQDEQFGNTALHQAAWNGFSETVQVLCKYRANTSLRNKAQFTPLHMAAQQGHNQTARLLLMASAKTEAKNSYGDTPIHTAARYGHAGVARILLSAKSNPNQVNKNHDTPLHIAAAMGRRKLTKIFMQNGAEPAIKNKQNETPMDIALRKDLIDIQELIANPPPMTANAGNKWRRQTTESPHHAHLSQLEQRFGQLYSGTSSQKLQQQQQQQLQQQQQQHHHQAALKTRTRHRLRQKHLSRHQAHLSSEDDSNELEHRMRKLHLHHQSDAVLTQKRHPKNYKEAFRIRGGDTEHMTGSSASFLRCAKMAVDELAVDVAPDADIEQYKRPANNGGNKILVNNKVAAFSSLHSLYPQVSKNSGLNLDRHVKPRAGGQLYNKYRMKTIENLNSQADLQLLPSPLLNGHESKEELTKRRSMKKGKSSDRLASSVELSDQLAAEAYLPDACDNPNDWADIMAKSALYRSTNSPVIENQLDQQQVCEDDKKKKVVENLNKLDFKMPTAKGRSINRNTKLPSPTGSIRSSLSKSQGRLIVRRRKPQQKASFLVRRPNLGTCVGKLSLQKLRGIVNKRGLELTTRDLVEDEDENEEEDNREHSNDDGKLLGEQVEDKQNEKETHEQQVEEDEDCKLMNRVEADKKGDKSALNKVPTIGQQKKPPVAAGRRQERIDRLENSGALRAPNGSQLIRTRPLASLTDDTQLYAVPKKTKPQQQQQVSNRSDATIALKNESKQQVKCEANCGTVLDNQAATSERVPSGGPALTSDGGDRSSVDSSGSSFPGITQHSSSSAIASSSDECIESMDLVCINKRRINNQITSNGDQCKRPAVVGVHITGGDADLYAPGYSFIQKRSNKVGTADTNSNHKTESTEACLCQPYGQQQQQQVQPADETKTTSDKATLMGHHETQSKVKALKSSSSQLEQQQPVNGGNQSNCSSESKTTTTTSKLRQLLHLESRAKSGVKLNGQRNIKTTSKTSTTLNESEEDNENGLNNVENDCGKEKEIENELSRTNNKLPLTAIAGGYYAYSPVVQSASELKRQSNDGVSKSSEVQQQENKSSGNNKSSGKKNWLMSKFSMSSNNLNNSNSQPIQDSSSIGSEQNSMLDNVKAKSIANKPESATDRASIDSSTLLGPERKAELIKIIGADLRDNNNKSLNNGATQQGFLSSPAPHDDNTSSSSSLHLIRPKSAFSTTSADLIAAQKSLASAAAEKVKRDRMVKLCSNNNINSNFINNKEHLTAQNDDGCLTTSKESVLTVKTSDPFWSSVVNQPIVAQNGISHQNYLIGQHQLVNHRSGANSVGMSDSSPSNNGAESDNSIQTTTGSANTDTTTSGAGVNGIISRGHGSSQLTTATNNKNNTTNTNNNKNQCSSLDQNSSSSPLGILSRILLNNKSFGYRTTSNNNKENDASLAQNSIDSAFNRQKGSQQFMQMPNGSLSSSSVLSSPSSNNHSPSTTTTTTDNRTSKQKLDQLTSRSRCPIVLTKSNGLPSEAEEDEEEEDQEKAQVKVERGKGRGEKEEIKEENNSSKWKDINEASPGVRGSTAPPLPAKGVLKMPSSRTLFQNNYNSKSAAPNGVVPLIQPESMNGLPRVSSYTQISSSFDQCPSLKQPFYGYSHLSKDNSKQLCSYHLLNQRNNPVSSQLMRTQYGPYSTTTTGPQNNGYCQELSTNKDRYHINPLLPPSQHHMSHHDLRSTIDAASSFADLTASHAINYEYYLEKLPFLQHPVNNGKGINHPNSQSHCNYTTANDNSSYLNYAHEDSIYIPEYMMATTKNFNKIRDISNGSAGVNELSGDDLMSKQKNNFFDQHQKHLLITGRPRPKSSLDTPFLSSSTVVNQHYPTPSISQSTTNNGRHFSANKTSPAAISVNSQQHSHRLLSSSSTSESQNSPSSVANQSLLNQHNINHFQEQYKQQQQQLPTYYSYSSPYHNSHNLSAYLYSENSIYASDQSVAFNRSSDLTVLPTAAADTDNVESSTINDQKQASSAEVEVSLTSGGNNKSGANNMVTCSTSSNNTQCPSSPASNQSDRSRTPKAQQQQQQQQQAVGGNSWMPNQPYKSLIQIRQLSSAKPNQSPSVGENTGQHISSSGSANFQLSNGKLEEESKTKETNLSSSFNSPKGPTKVFISNRAQSNDFEDNNDPPSTIQVFHEDLNTSTVL